jgi:hypothetical protein
MTTWQNRIVGQAVRPASAFLANPHNWRIHPAHQQAALEEVLDTVGWVQQVIENRRTGHLIDGHQRVLSALKRGDDTPVPVIFVDLSETEEQMILAALDPIGAMAVTDAEKLSALLDSVAPSGEALADLFAELRASLPEVEDAATPETDPAPKAPAYSVTITCADGPTFAAVVAALSQSPQTGTHATLSGAEVLAWLAQARTA